MRRCSLPDSPALQGGVMDRKEVVRRMRILARKAKGWDGFLKLFQKSLLMKAQGQGLLSHSQHGCCRFAALTPACTPLQSLCAGISFPRTRVWCQTPLQPLAAVTSRMLTCRNAGMPNCSLWL